MKFLDDLWTVFTGYSGAKQPGTPDSALYTTSHHTLCRALEPRIMLDAAAADIAGAADNLMDSQLFSDGFGAHGEGAESVAASAEQDLNALFDGYVPPAVSAASEQAVVFVDGGVEGLDSLLAGLPQGAEVHILDAGQDGILQMVNALEGRSDVSAIHVFAHGRAGEMVLGNSLLSADSLETNTAALQKIGASLADDADILLYGCDFGQDGAFIADLAAITGADIAASDDLTGTSALGGDWDLEVVQGDVDTSVMAVSSYSYVLAPPSLADMEASINLAENDINMTPAVLDTDVTFATNGTALDGLALVISHDGNADDQLSVRNAGVGFDQIGVAGTDVQYQGVTIGTIDAVNNGVNGADLRIVLNDQATEANIDRLLEHIQYANISDSPAAARDVTFTLDVTALHTMTVNVAAANDAPVVNAATLNVDEDAANGTLVGTVTVTDDAHPGTSIAYSILSGNDSGIFAIDNNGDITIADNTNLNFDNQQQYSLTVQADDTLAQSNGTITININSIFDDTQVVINDTSFVVSESAGIGVLVGTLPIIDVDTVAGNHIVNISTGNPGNVFAIDAFGDITVNGPLDREAKGFYDLVIFASDGTNSPDMATVRIQLVDVNDVVPQINDDNFTIDENVTIGTLVGKIPAIDPDLVSPKTFTITAGNTGGAFAVDNEGNITVAGTIDRDTLAQYTLTLNVDDTFGNDNATVVINVNDLNDTSPVVNDAVMAVDEDAAVNTVIGNVGATDVDLVSPLEYSIIGGNAGEAYSIDQSGNIILQGALDFEVQDSYALVVRVTDNVNAADTATVTVNLNDINDAPVFGETVLSVAENSAAGTVVGSVQATDQDMDVIGYAITGGNQDGFFAIDANGEITTTDVADLNFEARSSYQLVVEITDGTVIVQKTVTVNIENVGDVFFTNLAASNIEALPDVRPATFRTLTDLPRVVEQSVSAGDVVVVSDVLNSPAADGGEGRQAEIKTEVLEAIFANDTLLSRQGFQLRDDGSSLNVFRAAQLSAPQADGVNAANDAILDVQFRALLEGLSVATDTVQPATTPLDQVLERGDLLSGNGPVNLIDQPVGQGTDINDGAAGVDVLPPVPNVDVPDVDMQEIEPEAGAAEDAPSGLRGALEKEMMLRQQGHQDFSDMFATSG